MWSRRLLTCGFALVVLLSVSGSLRGDTPVQLRAYPSHSAITVDPIRRLQLLMDSGKVTLAHDSVTGYLASLLAALRIPVSSQGFVFSRTSLQTDLISPWSPRALYFNDDVYIGYVQESGILEIASVSPTEGAVFYTLDQQRKDRPAFKRDNTCLSCHSSATVSGFPGFLMLSSITDKSGYFLANVFQGNTADNSLVQDRFGGWYVTGTIKNGRHSGNVMVPKAFSEVSIRSAAAEGLDFVSESQRTTLKDKFETSRYLSGHSDIVALMVLAHQTNLHNTIVRVRDAAARALREDSAVSRYKKDTAFVQTRLVTSPRLQQAIDQLVHELLFVGAEPLPGPVKGTTSFTLDFESTGPRDKRGRSLRDFDLERRLFRFPLSFLIYSDGFQSLPDVTRQVIYQRLRAVLTGKDAGVEYANISASERKDILEILQDTIEEFPRE